MLRACDLRQKEVINICDASRLGYVYDVEINFENGNIEAIIVPGRTNVLSMFGKRNDYVIPWDKIVRVGEDVVLVQVQDFINKTS
ncbi:MAG: YlmC/YmxH family sporulation protein [Clostridia bacterium]|nr:YlmC/YmxH family sporulation protein [Clostridia bacterium]